MKMHMMRAAALATAFAAGGCIIEESGPPPPAPVYYETTPVYYGTTPVSYGTTTTVYESSPVFLFPPPGGRHSGTIRPPKHPTHKPHHHRAEPVRRDFRRDVQRPPASRPAAHKPAPAQPAKKLSIKTVRRDPAKTANRNPHGQSSKPPKKR